jgi:RNA polymerase sigma-70 factor, ECF subfamily
MVISNTQSPALMPCLLETWHLTESQLFRWLVKQCHSEDLAFDLLQETFLRALQQKQAFCEIENQKAWLFRVASHLLMDEWRHSQKFDIRDDEANLDRIEPPVNIEPIDSLAQCLPKALAMLSPDDRLIIERCDIHGESQQAFAEQYGLTLSAAKSRIQRARNKLRSILKENCQIRYDENQKVCCFFPSSSV